MVFGDTGGHQPVGTCHDKSVKYVHVWMVCDLRMLCRNVVVGVCSTLTEPSFEVSSLTQGVWCSIAMVSSCTCPVVILLCSLSLSAISALEPSTLQKKS